VQDHRQKFSVFKSIGYEEQMRAMESTKRRLVLQGSIWRKEVLKIRGSEDHQKLTSSEALSSEPGYQKLMLSEVLKIIRSWRLEVSEVCQMLLLSCIWMLIKDWKPRAIANSENLKGIGCLSTEERWKKDNSTIVQPPSPLLCFVSAIVQNSSCDYAGIPLYLEWIWNCSFIGWHFLAIGKWD